MSYGTNAALGPVSQLVLYYYNNNTMAFPSSEDFSAIKGRRDEKGLRHALRSHRIRTPSAPPARRAVKRKKLPIKLPSDADSVRPRSIDYPPTTADRRPSFRQKIPIKHICIQMRLG
ncbi:hypothetical protein QTP88_006943 [Uroleucon formosanum]